MIMTLKFEMRIGNGMMRVIFNNRAKVNILLYPIILILKLIIRTNVIVHIKGTGNYKSSFIKYVSYVSVRIGDIIMRQPFFILECGLTTYILKRSFETIAYLQQYIMNNRFI